MSPLARTRTALALVCLVCVGSNCANFRAPENAAELITDAVCLAVTAITEDEKVHDVCATAEDIAPFVDAIRKRQRERAQLKTSQQLAMKRLLLRPVVRLTRAQLAAADCDIPSNHPSQGGATP
jgi:hypothetical protein